MEGTSSLQIIAICILVFLTVGFIAYIFSKKVRDVVDRAYNRNIHFLQNKRLYFFARGLSHGGIHFVTFIFVLVLVFFMIEKTDGYKVNPHKIEVSFFRERFTELEHDTIFDMKNFDLTFILNSDSVYKRSNGISRNSILLSYKSDRSDSIHCGFVRIKGNFKDNPIKVIRDTVYVYSIPQGDGSKKDTTITCKADYKIKQINDTICEVEFYPAKNLPSLLGTAYGLQTVEIASDAFGNEEENPYYYNFYTINVARNPVEPDGYNVKYSVQFGDEMYSDDSYFTHSSKNIKYDYIFPDPDEVSNGIINFSSIESCNKSRKKDVLLYKQRMLIC